MEPVLFEKYLAGFTFFRDYPGFPLVTLPLSPVAWASFFGVMQISPPLQSLSISLSISPSRYFFALFLIESSPFFSLPGYET